MPSKAEGFMPEQSAGEAKLAQYLNEAYGLEKRLETALEAHIAMTTRAPYKKRLKEHLSETKRHGREVGKRIKQLGGTAETVSAPGPDPIAGAAQAVVGGAQKAIALAQGPLHALRGTGGDEKQLKNAKTEYASEAEEIATYIAIEALAQALGDKETERLARSIRRDEERMRSFLEKEIPRLTKAVRNAELPPSQRKPRKPTAKRKAATPRARVTSTRTTQAKASTASSRAARAKAGSR
jgi:ferritin-like metal-binding protein YciE